MTQKTLLFALALVLSLSSAHSLCGAENQNEQNLISILSGNASLQEKDAACAKLKVVGTRACIPAVSALLKDRDLAHSARYVLESLPHPEAGTALVQALSECPAEVKPGLVQSIGMRKEASGVGPLAMLIDNGEPALTGAAWYALGRIGGTEAQNVLLKSLDAARNAGQIQLADAALTLAASRIAGGAGTSALPLVERLIQESWPAGIQVAAHRLAFIAAPDGLEKAVEALKGPETPARVAALALATEDYGDNLWYAAALETGAPEIQPTVINNVARNGGTVALPKIVNLVHSPSEAVRIAALDAVGELGSDANVGLLAGVAASRTGAEQASARNALARLNQGDVAGAILRDIEKSSARECSELVRALAERRERTALQPLARLAGADDNATANAAMQGLAALATQAEMPTLVSLVIHAPHPARRAKAVEALNSTVQRIVEETGTISPEPISKAAEEGKGDSEAALLPVLSGIAHPAARKALVKGIASSDANFRQAAIAATCDSIDPELLPVITGLALQNDKAMTRSKAIAGCVRLWVQDEPLRVPVHESVRSAKALVQSGLSDDEARKVLAGLGQISDGRVLELATPFLRKPGTREEAANAIIQVAGALAESASAKAVLKEVESVDAVTAFQEPTRKALRNALRHVDARLAFITQWEVSGPFSQSGKNYAALFDVPFPPEQSSAAVEWKAAELSTDPAKVPAVDLLKSFGGEQRVAYARVTIHSAIERSCILEMDSDDGVKVWLNGALVHANNTARPLKAAQDRVPVQLKTGENRLLVKVTQNNLGWEFTARFLNNDGSALSDVRAETK